jgi:nucleoside-diphosphate-sugar epimerase
MSTGRRIFVAGAAGAIGRRLTPLLVRSGFHVTGTTRSAAKGELIEALGATPVVVDVFDAAALAEAVSRARPDVVIHQLTDLPAGLDPSQMARAIERNAHIRREGTRNLVDAAAAAGAHRVIAQSIAWAYAPGRMPHVETDPLDVGAASTRGITVGGVAALEDAVLHHRQIDGVVLRYGRLYGPGTGADNDAKDVELRLHVDAAAYAALLAVDHGRGAYKIAETDTLVSCDKARRELGWNGSMRIGSREPVVAGAET